MAASEEEAGAAEEEAGAAEEEEEEEPDLRETKPKDSESAAMNLAKDNRATVKAAENFIFICIINYVWVFVVRV